MNDYFNQGQRGPNDSGPVSEDAPKGLPFDPMRLLLSLYRGRYVLLAVFGAAVVLGFLLGLFLIHPHYTGDGQFLRQQSNTSVQATDDSSSYKPHDLSIATLVSLMKSQSVLEATAHATHLSVVQLREHLVVAQKRGTELINATYTGTSPDQVVTVLGAYGRAVLHFTEGLSASEAKDVDAFLQGQLVSVNAQLLSANKALVHFSKASGSVDLNKEVNAVLDELGTLDLKYHTVQLDYDTLDLKIDSLRHGLISANPISVQLSEAEATLTQMRSQYASKNPLLLEQQDRVSALQAQMAQIESGKLPVPRPTGQGAGAGIYEDLVRAQAQKAVLGAQVKQLKSLRDRLQQRLSHFSSFSMEYATLKARQQSLQAVQAMLATRQRDAAFYSHGGFAYYRFLPVHLQDVARVGRMKHFILFFLGFVFFAGFCSLCFYVFRDLADRRLITPADASRTLPLPLLGSLPSDLSEDAQRYWAVVHCHTLFPLAQPNVVGVVAGSSSENSVDLLQPLVLRATTRISNVVVLSPSAPPDSVALDAALANPAVVQGTVWVQVTGSWTLVRRCALEKALAVWSAAHVQVFIDLPPADSAEALLLADLCHRLVWLVESGRWHVADLLRLVVAFEPYHSRFAGVILSRPPVIPFKL